MVSQGLDPWKKDYFQLDMCELADKSLFILGTLVVITQYANSNMIATVSLLVMLIFVVDKINQGLFFFTETISFICISTIPKKKTQNLKLTQTFLMFSL